MNILIVNLIVLLGLFGFSVSFYIYDKKKQKKKLICPRRSNCETVIHSDYSRILGVPVEVLGMIYYTFISITYSAVFIFHIWSQTTALLLLGVSMCSVLFSVYLVTLQIFIIRHMCVWCLLSAFTSLAIFILSYINIILY